MGKRVTFMTPDMQASSTPTLLPHKLSALRLTPAYGVYIGPARAPYRVPLMHKAASGDFAYPRCVISASQYRQLTGVDPDTLPGDEHSRTVARQPPPIDEYTSPSEGEYRAGYTFAQCVAFVREEDRNPKTGRSIERFGPTWRALNQSAIVWGLRRYNSVPTTPTTTNLNTTPTTTTTTTTNTTPTKTEPTITVRVNVDGLARARVVHDALRNFVTALARAPANPVPRLIVIDHMEHARAPYDRTLLRGTWDATSVTFIVHAHAHNCVHEADMMTRARDVALPLLACSDHVLVVEHVSDVTLDNEEHAMLLRSSASFLSLISAVTDLCSMVSIRSPLTPSDFVATCDDDVTWYASLDWSARAQSGATDAWRQLACIAAALRSPLLASMLLEQYDGWTAKERKLLRAM